MPLEYEIKCPYCRQVYKMATADRLILFTTSEQEKDDELPMVWKNYQLMEKEVIYLRKELENCKRDKVIAQILRRRE